MPDFSANMSTLFREHPLSQRDGHMHFPEERGRAEAGPGEIDFRQIFDLFESLDYRGYVGAEYYPTTVTSASLDWLSACPAVAIR